ncbi:flagellar basal body-associated FliL family protein [Pseudaminobacter sp. 19-2017]|uniref:Flagellar protein FliL n=1 Tax=Pseudaminobacter soli (ex Zhang et al. 2022) TaxID=2831468 RepID=A0A942E3L1_9HYPH|nr:flagellar basal body-associated FliL family protein [Pseudaminobacter soli]MBS3650336.1 flagellar basal body-associated FliL family protein [Pseudaminobacter soli]
MAITDQSAPPPRGPSLVVQGAVLLLMTAAAVGGGWFAGDYLGKNSAPAVAEEATTSQTQAGAHGAAGAPGQAGAHGPAVGPVLVPLESMTTNLAAPTTVWIRLEMSLLLEEPLPLELVETIHQDLLAYLRTVKLHQIEGASGYQHLKEDLEERARIRSDGKVKQILVRTLLFE